MDLELLRRLYEANTISYVTMFQAVCPLLKTTANSDGDQVELLVLSSQASSITDMEALIHISAAIYGLSKAVLHFLVCRTHLDVP